jgi:hypothetical protein
VNLRSNDHSTRRTLVPTLLRYGVAQDLELRAVWNVVTHVSTPLGDKTWTGPFTLGFKYRLNPGAAGFLHPSFGIEGSLVLPLATEGRDTGKLEPALSLNVDHFVTRRGTFTWNLVAFAPVDAAGEQYAQGFFGATYTQAVSDAVQLFVAGEGRVSSASSGGSSTVALGAGLFWYLSQRVVLF